MKALRKQQEERVNSLRTNFLIFTLRKMVLRDWMFGVYSMHERDKKFFTNFESKNNKLLSREDTIKMYFKNMARGCELDSPN
jgi:hypothetical protein